MESTTEQQDQPSQWREILATHCLRCGRALSNPRSMERGMGPVCAARVEREMRQMSFMDEEES